MVHIWNFGLRKVFHNNVFFMFHRFVDNITAYVLYDGISKNYSCRSFRFWGCRSFVNGLGLETITILRMICNVTNQILLLIMLFSFSSISFSSTTLKRLNGTRLFRSLLSNVLSFAGIFRAPNFSILLLSFIVFIL